MGRGIGGENAQSGCTNIYCHIRITSRHIDGNIAAKTIRTACISRNSQANIIRSAGSVLVRRILSIAACSVAKYPTPSGDSSRCAGALVGEGGDACKVAVAREIGVATAQRNSLASRIGTNDTVCKNDILG